ncbi:hypothetical protein Asi02nite_40130 [Asanoa siamensis]|uniref:Uncharacterized protein n=1 Tax=Asanoa siamensis TaxID=926357 RepID=A0ABQ4CT73_9ACTN|nr:hypothetical protein Asi02nite_40130 [Asanoa siamensis]
MSFGNVPEIWRLRSGYSGVGVRLGIDPHDRHFAAVIAPTEPPEKRPSDPDCSGALPVAPPSLDLKRP